MESRKKSNSKPSDLPLDYVKMVEETFSKHFSKHLKNSHFIVQGNIFSNETLIAVSLTQSGQMNATTVYASTDFDPKASVPQIQDLLDASIDTIAHFLEHFFKSTTEEPIEPFEWTESEINLIRVYLRFDRANLSLEQLTDQWLAQHDPEVEKQATEQELETQKLFVTGPRPETHSHRKK